MGVVLIALTLTGATWFAWDVVTNDTGSLTGDRFERIDHYVTDHSLTVMAVGGLAVLTGLARVAHLVSTRSTGNTDQDVHNFRHPENATLSPELIAADTSRPPTSERQHA